MIKITLRLVFNIIIFSLLILCLGCNFNKSDTIEIDHYFGGVGLSLSYKIDNNKVIVMSNCDFEDCSDKIIYKRKISESEIDEFKTKIKFLKIDTLKNEYINSSILDGQYTEICFGNKLNVDKKVMIVQNVKLNILDSITNYMDNLVLDKKYKLNSFGEE